MNIETKTSADVVALTIKSNTQNDGKEAYVDVEIGVDQPEATAKFGEEFEGLAFSSMRLHDTGEETKVIHLQDTIKPGKRVVLEKHVIDFNGTVVKALPQLLSIRTIDGADRVVAKVRVPLDVGTKLVTELTELVGKMVDMEFSPQQQVLDLDAARPQAVG